MSVLISCNKLAFAYDGRTVLSGVNFDVEEGDYLCIVGENGSGKSTLIKGLLGLKIPSSGSVELRDGLKRYEIGYLQQQTAVRKDFPAGVLEVVLSGCLNKSGLRPFYSKAEKRAAAENLELMGVDYLKKRSFCELSGGQQRRVLIARALCSTGKLLILDEPVSGLDSEASKELYETVNRLNKDRRIAIVMVTHDTVEAASFADKILLLAEGGAVCMAGNDFLSGGKGLTKAGSGIYA